MRKPVARVFSMKKWDATIENNGEALDLEQNVELGIENFKGTCGYCELYFETDFNNLVACAKCPIRPKVRDYDDLSESGCMQKCHPYRTWWYDKTKKNAEGVRELVRKS